MNPPHRQSGAESGLDVDPDDRGRAVVEELEEDLRLPGYERHLVCWLARVSVRVSEHGPLAVAQLDVHRPHTVVGNVASDDRVVVDPCCTEHAVEWCDRVAGLDIEVSMPTSGGREDRRLGSSSGPMSGLPTLLWTHPEADSSRSGGVLVVAPRQPIL